MSIRYSYHIGFVALLLLLAACTKDELADDARLPEGQYPLQIAAVTLSVEGGEAQPWGAPQTRVSENADGTGSVWEWDGSEMIGVQLGDKTTTYTLNTDHTLLADRQLYWTSTAPNQPVTAWYPATDGTLDLRDQDTNGLAYLLHGTGTGDYLTPVTLTFTHSLAKVRVTPTGDALGEVQSLQLYTYTQCTYAKGTVVQGSQKGWIKMKKCEYTDNGTTITCWEANVVPDYEITKLRANGNEERTLSSGITPVAGKFYNITLNKDLGYTEVSEGNYTVDNEKGLKNLAKLVNDGNTGIDITLTGNITLTGDWTPIGKDDNKAYTGTFDGNGKIITGLTIDQKETSFLGLIGYLGSGGKVQNLTLENVNLNGNWNVGGVVGYNNNGTVTACTASGSINGKERVGGIVGCNYLGTVTACYNTSSTVNGSYLIGGVVGQNNKGIVTACYNASGSIYGEVTVGGVVGDNYTGTVTACYWSNYAGYGIGNGTGDATKVDGTTVTWQTAVDAMNAALQSAGSEWQYELTGALPTLKEQ